MNPQPSLAILKWRACCIISVKMKMFDLGELRKSARLQETSRSKSISDMSRSPRRGSESSVSESLYLSRWGINLENRGAKTQPWVNVGQGIHAIAVGEKHAIILNNKHECYGCGSNTYGQIAVEQGQTTKPMPIASLKDMKITGVFCGSYHSFVQTVKGELYGFGLNMKGQLGIGTFDNQKKPMLVYGLLPGGNKHPKAHAYIEVNECHKKSRGERASYGKEPLTDIQNLLQQREPADLVFHLAEGESIVDMACGPLHSLALSSRGRLFSCGYGEHFTLGTGDQTTHNEFREVKTKLAKIERVQTGLMGFAVLAAAKVYVCGKFGQETYQVLTPLNFAEEVRDLRCSGSNCLMLTRKGELYQFGEFLKDTGDKYFAETPRRIERVPTVGIIFGGLCGYFAVCDNKTLWGWGDNSSSQITGGRGPETVGVPSPVRVPVYLGDHIKIVPGSSTTYLLSSKPLDVDYDRYESPEPAPSSGSEEVKKSLTKKKSFIKTNERNLLGEIGVEPRTFSQTLEIDFAELVFEKQISEGGYGIIYKGKWRETTVAIKIFKIESEGAVRDFFSECAAMEALRHPNIVMFLGACTKPPNLAIVLEYCCRGSLWSTIQNLELQLSWEDRRRFALDTAKGVHYLHSCHPPIIHRDLKSLNLLLDESYRVKLADFGWTKGLDKYMTGKIGTYQWMAPEVIGSEQYSEKADVFSFGIILWEIASREPPYRSMTGAQVSMEVLNNDMRPTIPKKTPEPFARLMKKCWDRDPLKRPSFKDIIKDLEIMKL